MRRLSSLTVIAIVALVLVSGAMAHTAGSSRKIPGHTKRQAELNVLHAIRVLSRWKTPFVDPRTNTIRSNTTVACSGRVRSTRPQRFASFVCVLRYEGSRVRLRYTAFTGNGFGMKRLG